MKKYFCDVCGKEFDPGSLPVTDVTYPARDACSSIEDICPECVAVGKSLEIEQLVLEAWRDASKADGQISLFEQQGTDPVGEDAAPEAPVPDMETRGPAVAGEPEVPVGIADEIEEDGHATDAEPVPAAEDARAGMPGQADVGDGSREPPATGMEGPQEGPEEQVGTNPSDAPEAVQEAVTSQGEAQEDAEPAEKRTYDVPEEAFQPKASVPNNWGSNWHSVPVNRTRGRKKKEPDPAPKPVSARSGPGSHWAEKRETMERLVAFRRNGLGTTHKIAEAAGLSPDTIRSMLDAKPHPIDEWRQVKKALDRLEKQAVTEDGEL